MLYSKHRIFVKYLGGAQLTKKMLSQSLELRKEIKDLKARIAKVEKRNDIVSDTVQSSNGFPYTQHNVGISGVSVRKYKLLNEYQKKLDEFMIKLLQLQNKIEDFIETLDDTVLRQIMRYRYIDGFGWVKIMHLMGYESESKARMKHDRFLEKI